ncbi:MAG TPA: MBL fold metallo-hydrolase [Oscillospiraceae bacterium]|nr:MBL fold metallo-hydrolase [Oscillospiraceae bacterium]
MLEICMLASGSSGNAIYVATGETKILIDAGLSGKKIAAALCAVGVEASELSALLLSHDHVDHTSGAGVMARRYGLPVYATEPTWQAAGKLMGRIAAEQCCKLTNCGTITLGDLTVETIPVPHDAADPVGFVFRHGPHAIALVTDLGYVTPYILQRLQAMDCLVLEANHDEEMLRQGQYPWPLKKRILSDKGHLSNNLAAASLSQVISEQTQHVVLAHLSEQNNCPQLAFDTVCCHLEETGQLKNLAVHIAERHLPSCHIRLA